ncbi:hypothetical protein BDB01DRAFT_721138 [Pilobolus umbonatus]|nr:hypothetical protein BDB01DRAFT_721138 [Pilobolus umbonatus]
MLLDHVGYRNEISMLTMTANLLKSRLYSLNSLTFTENDDMKEWNKYSLMYRRGQEDVLNITIKKIEEMKYSLIQHMAQDIKENNIGAHAPFLSIVNGSRQDDSLELDSSPFLSLDSVTITVKKLLRKNIKLSQVIDSLFEDLEEEADMIMMLGLIKEKSNSSSEWKLFFDEVESSEYNKTPDEDIMELYESMLLPLSESYPDIFDTSIYTPHSLVWANHLLNDYSINDPLAIVPI